MMEPWYKVATPRKEVREGRSFSPDEFAIALEQVVAGTAPEDYKDPQKFFARTCFAQPLGIHLDDWKGRIIEIEKGGVRLLAVSERARQLFGTEGAAAMAERIEREPTSQPQLTLFTDSGTAPEVKGRGRGRKRASVGGGDEPVGPRREATTLDRIHAAMLLQASGRTNALRALLKAEQEHGPDFLRLANALSALYPKQNEEKRLLDAMLLAVPR